MFWVALGDIPLEQSPVLKTPDFFPGVRREGGCRGYYFVLMPGEEMARKKE